MNRKTTSIEGKTGAANLNGKLQDKLEANCPPSQTRVQMVTPEQASAFTGIASQTIYRWIEDNQIHSQNSGEGRLLICLSSLRETYANSIKETKKVQAISRERLLQEQEESEGACQSLADKVQELQRRL